MVKNAYAEERLDQITIFKLVRKRGNNLSFKKIQALRKTVIEIGL